MKELPILEQTTSVQPSLGGGNFGAAAAQSAQADLQIANFGAEIAQNAATQRARLAGIEAGKNPRGQDVGVFTKTDEAYVQAYKQEALSSQEFKGKQLINDMFSELSKNPTAEGLALFKNESLKAIDDYSANVPKDVQEGLRRSLEGAAMEGFYSLEGAWESRQKADRVSLWKQSTDSDTYGISNAMRTGNRDLALSIAESTYAKTIEAEKRGDVPAGTAAKTKEMVEQTLHSSQGILGLEQSAEPEKYMANLKDESWLKKLPMHAQDAVIASVVNHYNQQQAAKGAQQGINYTNYQTKIATSTMTPTDWMQAENEVSGQQFASLRQKQALLAADENSTASLIAKAAAHPNDYAYWAANFTPDQVDKITRPLLQDYANKNGLNEQDLTQSQMTEALMGTHYPVKKLTNLTDASIENGTINQAREAAIAIKTAEAMGNYNLFENLKDETKVMASLLNNAAINPNMDEKRMDDLRQSVYHATPQQKEQGQKAVNAFFAENRLKSPERVNQRVLNHLNKGTGIFTKSVKIIPPEAATLYENYMRAYANMTSDAKLADSMALDNIKRTFLPTEINGRKEFMANPMESVYPDNGKYGNENLKRLAITKLIAFNKLTENKTGKVVAKISWADMPTEGSPTSKDVLWGPEGDVILDYQVGNGPVRKIRVLMASDELTQSGVEAGDPNWALRFEYVGEEGLGTSALPFSDNNYSAMARIFPNNLPEKIRSNPELQAVMREMWSNQKAGIATPVTEKDLEKFIEKTEKQQKEGMKGLTGVIKKANQMKVEAAEKDRLQLEFNKRQEKIKKENELARSKLPNGGGF